MATKVITKIENSFTYTLHHATCWCVLECGHAGDVILRDYAKNAHDINNQLTKVGDVVDCKACDYYADAIKRLRALAPGELSHARFRPRDSRGFGDGDYFVYVRDRTSPTGVELWLAVQATKEAGDLLCALRAAPLSPTERR